MTEELKACPNPWCESHKHEGGGPRLPDDLWELSGSRLVRIVCHYCSTQGPHADTEAAAVSAWNSRPAIISELEDYRRLREAVEHAIDLMRHLHPERARFALERALIGLSPNPPLPRTNPNDPRH